MTSISNSSLSVGIGIWTLSVALPSPFKVKLTLAVLSPVILNWTFFESLFLSKFILLLLILIACWFTIVGLLIAYVKQPEQFTSIILVAFISKSTDPIFPPKFTVLTK